MPRSGPSRRRPAIARRLAIAPSAGPSRRRPPLAVGCPSGVGLATHVLPRQNLAALRARGYPGITAISTDRATIEITNHTGRTWYYRVSGWQLDQFETCRALGEVEVQRGPIAAGTTERVMLFGNWEQLDVPITIAFWDKRCGEACQREPIAAMVVVRSLIEPAAS